MRAAVYARVSSSAQRDRDTIESQLRVLPEYVRAQGWLLAGTYVDDGRTAKSGRLDDRDGFARLVRDADAKLFDLVVVVDVDRLTRTNDLEERAKILGPFQRNGIDIVTPSGGRQDLRSMMGELYITMQALVAAEENRKRSARVRAGKITAATRGGKVTGRNPYGLIYTKPSSWALHPEQAPIVVELFERVAAGVSCYALADDLNARGVPYLGLQGNTAWHRGRVYELIKSRHPVGEYIAHKVQRIAVSVPAMVTEELWQRAQDMLTNNRRAPLRRTKYVYLLEGLAVCGACGGRMLMVSGCLERGRFWRPTKYVCENRKNRKVGPTRCTAPKVLQVEADARAWAAICREFEDPELPAELAADRRAFAADGHNWERDAEGYRAHLARLDKVAASHLARFRRGGMTDQDLDTELAAVNRERAAVRAQLATAERARGTTISARARLNDATAAMERLRAKLEAATPEERRDIVQSVIDPGGVVFHGAQIRAVLMIDRAASGRTSSGALVAVRDCSPGDEGRLKIRLVA